MTKPRKKVRKLRYPIGLRADDVSVILSNYGLCRIQRGCEQPLYFEIDRLIPWLTKASKYLKQNKGV